MSDNPLLLKGEMPPPSGVPAVAPGMPAWAAAILAVATVGALYFGREILIPVTIAMLLSFMLSPLIDLFRRLRLGRIPSVLLAVLIAISVIVGLGTAIGVQVGNLAQEIPEYQATVERKITGLLDNTLHKLDRAIAGISGQVEGHTATTPRSAPAALASHAASSAGTQQPIPVVVTQPLPSALAIAETILSPLLHPLETIGIILVVSIFALLQREDLRDRAIRLFGSGDLQRTTVAMNEAARRLSRYFLTQLGINTCFGIIIAGGLWLIGVPHPFLWGILGLLLRFIPYIGSWIAAVLPLALTAAVDPGWTMTIWTGLLYVVSEGAMGQVVEPLLYGHSTGLSPFAVVIAAIFWTWIWGPIGLLISTPLTLCFVVLGRHVERLEFLDVLLGDRPALTPVEGFYQRMLADDPDEALAQAEQYLAERPLSSYYDEVALRGLQLAANDVQRGALPAQKVERLKSAVKELVDDLDRFDDDPRAPAAEPEPVAGPTIDQQTLPKVASASPKSFDPERAAPQWRSETPILCIAGRGPLDEAASTMLAQLLVKHGLGARAARYEEASRAGVGRMDVGGVAMVCISYLEITGNPAHLRYLLQRLRKRLPDVELLVGLWPANDPVLRDAELRRLVGADRYVNTLHEAVDACIEAASANSANQTSDALAVAGQ
jgi:predicted PurR-regulated permease PerM